MPASNSREGGFRTRVMWKLILLLVVHHHSPHGGESIDAPGASPAGECLLHPGPAERRSLETPNPDTLTGAAPAPYTYTDTRRLEQNRTTMDCLNCSTHINTDNLQRPEKREIDSMDSDSGHQPMKNGTTEISFFCPNTRWKENDCFVVYPGYDSEDNWAWRLVDSDLVKVSKMSSLLPHKVNMIKGEVVSDMPLTEMPDL